MRFILSAVRNQKHIFFCTSVKRGGERHIRVCLRGDVLILLLPCFSAQLTYYWPDMQISYT